MATTDPALDTELPAAVALSDTLANPTAPAVGAHGLVWDPVGAKWKRAPGTRSWNTTTDSTETPWGSIGAVGPVKSLLVTLASSGGALGILDFTTEQDPIASGAYPYVHNMPYFATGTAGSPWVMARTPGTFKSIASTSVTAGSPVAGWTPASGKKFRLMGYALSLSVAGSVVLQDATTEKIRTPLMPAGIGQPSPAMGNGILSATAGNSLNLDVTATGTVSGFIYGTEE